MTVPAPALDDKGQPITPPVTPPAAGAPKPAEDTGKTVPLPELLKTRERAQTAEAERDSLKSTLAYMQQQSQMQPQHYQQQQQPVQQQANQQQVEMQRLWETDTQKAVQAEIMMAINWFDNLSQAIDTQEAQVTQKYTDYGNFRDQVRTYMRSIPINQRNQPGVVEAAYYFVKGQNVDNIIKTNQEEMIRKIRAGENVQGFEAGAGTPPPVTPQALTDEQKRVAAAMGLTPEQYQSNVK